MPDLRNTPAISVLMPCRDAAETLCESLDSLVNQCFDSFEVLVWDDGSTDATSDTLRIKAREDDRIRLCGSERVGLVPALQRLSTHARGGLIARMDADDVCHPERFAAQVSYLEEHGDVVLCGCRHESFGDAGGSGRARYDTWLNGLTEPESIARELFIECPIAHPTLMMRRSAFEDAGGYEDHGWPEDYDLLMRLALRGGSLGKVARTLLRWRHAADRTSLTDGRYSTEQFRALKRHYLPEFHPRTTGTFHQWGAGEVGKRWLREWEHPPAAVVDVHPRKIGSRIHGVPVIAAEELPEPGAGFTVVAVGAPGAREDIRSWYGARGYEELRDFVFLA